MKTIGIAVLLLAAAQGAVAAQGFLRTSDTEALSNFRCAAAVGTVRDAMRESGFDALGGLPEMFDRAGKAAVVKAVLLSTETGNSLAGPKVSFTSARTVEAVSRDVSSHRAEGASSVGKGANALMGECLSRARLQAARELAEWFADDVSLFERLK